MQRHISTVTTKGQATIPAEIRRLLRITPHDKVAFLVEAGQVRIAPAAGVVAWTKGILSGDQPALASQAEKAAAEEAMAEEAIERGR